MRRADSGGFGRGMAADAGRPMPAAMAQQAGGNGAVTLSVSVDRVLTNVVVRDKKTGAVVKGLKASDFQIDGRQEAAEDHHLRLPERG